jgi:hypothetical protein
MNAEKEPTDKENGTERLSRWGRNVNALGALAVAGIASIIPGPNVVLAAWAGINAAQAGGFEVLRRHTMKKRRKKSEINSKN